jgi:TRAP-type C4-dicarboxylate transport system substrate-binding protein
MRSPARLRVLVLSLPVLLLLAPPPAAAQEKLKFSFFAPPAHNHYQNVILPWAAELKKRTNGKIELTLFPGGALCKPLQQYECARDGIADLAWGLPGWTPGKFPASGVIELPFMFRTAATGSQILADLWERHLRKEYDDVHVLYMHTHPAGHIHTHSKPVRTVDDLKGLKIRAPTAVIGDLLQLLGAAQVGMPTGQIYESMRSRVIDGFVIPFEAVPPFRLQEVTKYHTETTMYSSAFALYMNKAKYQALPPDVRKVLDETTAPGAGAWRRIGEVWDRAEGAGRKMLVDQGHEVITLSKDERGRWQQAARALDDKFAADLEAKGLPGRALVKDARELSAKYGEAD